MVLTNLDSYEEKIGSHIIGLKPSDYFASSIVILGSDYVSILVSINRKQLLIQNRFLFVLFGITVLVGWSMFLEDKKQLQ